MRSAWVQSYQSGRSLERQSHIAFIYPLALEKLCMCKLISSLIDQNAFLLLKNGSIQGGPSPSPASPSIKQRKQASAKTAPLSSDSLFSAPLCCLIYWWRKNCTNCDLLSSSQGALCRIHFTARSVNEFGLEIKLTGAELGELKHNRVDLHHISPPGNRLFDKTVLD